MLSLPLTRMDVIQFIIIIIIDYFPKILTSIYAVLTVRIKLCT